MICRCALSASVTVEMRDRRYVVAQSSFPKREDDQHMQMHALTSRILAAKMVSISRMFGLQTSLSPNTSNDCQIACIGQGASFKIGE